MADALRCLVTGAGGQVGRHLVRAAGGALDLVALDRAALDVTDAGAVRRALAEHRPDVVVHAAAYTAVDRAEAEPEAAFAVNRDGARAVAEGCAASGAALVHLSTDYVFDGARGGPYLESDSVSPANVYGASKAAGEAAVRALARHVIVRTAWVFSAAAPNFVRTILRLGAERDRLEVVADQWGHPTWAGDVARACLSIAEQIGAGADAWGTVHYAGAPLATWHDLASATLDAASACGIAARVVPVPTSAMPRPAPRPRRVELSMDRARDRWGLEAPDWRRRVGEVVQEAAPHGAS